MVAVIDAVPDEKNSQPVPDGLPTEVSPMISNGWTVDAVGCARVSVISASAAASYSSSASGDSRSTSATLSKP